MSMAERVDLFYAPPLEPDEPVVNNVLPLFNSAPAYSLVLAEEAGQVPVPSPELASEENVSVRRPLRRPTRVILALSTGAGFFVGSAMQVYDDYHPLITYSWAAINGLMATKLTGSMIMSINKDRRALIKKP